MIAISSKAPRREVLSMMICLRIFKSIEANSVLVRTRSGTKPEALVARESLCACAALVAARSSISHDQQVSARQAEVLQLMGSLVL
eukprot:2566749-Amphidinium_carterae.1